MTFKNSYIFCIFFCIVLIGCEKYQPPKSRTTSEAPAEIPLMPTDEQQATDLMTTLPSEDNEMEMIPTSNTPAEPASEPQTLQTSHVKTDKQEQPQATQQKEQTSTNPTKNLETQTKQEQSVKTKTQEGTISDKELDFEVENQTGKTVYVVCFSYIKKRPFSRWRWDKSSTYKIDDNKSVVINLDTIPDEEDRNNTFGYLGVFENEKDAENSIFELLDDNKKIDLDIVSQLKGKKVTIEVEKYGIAGEFYDYDFVGKKKAEKQQAELDFYVENKTGKTILVTCFVYEKKAKGTWLAKKTKEAWTDDEDTRDDMSVWRFDKTPLVKIKPNETGLIDVDTIIEPRDREYVRGYLAIFDEDEKEQAEKSVYELLPAGSKRKIELGRLINIKNKKVSVYTERYGVMGQFIDYNVRSTQKPNIKKVIDGHLNIK